MKGPSLKTEFSITSRPVTGFSRLGFKLFLSAFNLYQILLEHRFVLYLFFLQLAVVLLYSFWDWFVVNLDAWRTK